MYKVGIYGDTGMVGSILDKFIGNHDSAEVAFRKNSKRTEGDLASCSLCFLATKDAESMMFAREVIDAGIRVIDMSGAFRLPQDRFEKWYGIPHTETALLDEAVYGMPAFNMETIKGARLVANPGCYATSVILALRPILPCLAAGQEAVVVSTSGNSGARKEAESEANDITYAFGKNHKHVPEMNFYTSYVVDFTPIVLRSVFCGINTNIRVPLCDRFLDMEAAQVQTLLEDKIRQAYTDDDLVMPVRDSSDYLWGTMDVNGTNKMLVKVRVAEGFVYICSMLDNLIKGAAGQAVENMNLMLGLPRLTGIPE